MTAPPGLPLACCRAPGCHRIAPAGRRDRPETAVAGSAHHTRRLCRWQVGSLDVVSALMVDFLRAVPYRGIYKTCCREWGSQQCDYLRQSLACQQHAVALGSSTSKSAACQQGQSEALDQQQHLAAMAHRSPAHTPSHRHRDGEWPTKKTSYRKVYRPVREWPFESYSAVIGCLHTYSGSAQR